MTYQEWAEQHGHQKAAPQAFDNHLHTYTYHARSDPKPEAPKPPVGHHINYYWPQQACYTSPQQYAYVPYQYGYYPQAAAPTATATPPMYYYPGQYQQYYPTTYAVASPPDNNAQGYHHHWYGRTPAEVDEDNRRIAAREKVYEPNEMRPLNPRDDQQFWVRELDGTHTLRTYATIESALQPGKWHKDPNYGYAYFVRSRA